MYMYVSVYIYISGTLQHCRETKSKKQKTVHERDEYASISTHTLSTHTRTHLSPSR